MQGQGALSGAQQAAHGHEWGTRGSSGLGSVHVDERRSAGGAGCRELMLTCRTPKAKGQGCVTLCALLTLLLSSSRLTRTGAGCGAQERHTCVWAQGVKEPGRPALRPGGRVGGSVGVGWVASGFGSVGRLFHVSATALV